MHLELGTVISTEEGPSTMEFSFVVTNPKVRKGQFVQTNNEEGLLVGMVTEITRANRYFERAESVAEYERSGSMPSFPTAEWEYVIAMVRALGVFKKEQTLQRATFPAAPGSKVEVIDEALLKSFLGFVDNGVNIGKVANHELLATLPLNGLLQKHLSVLAMSGAGKSYFSSVLIEELLDRKPEHGRLAIVVVDVHGEYLGFRQGEYGSRTKVFDGKKLRIATHKIPPQMFGEFLPELSSGGLRDLAVVIDELKKESREKHEGYELKDIIARIEAEKNIKENMKGPMLSWLYQLQRLRIFGKADNPLLKDLAKPGHLAILDLSDIDSMKKKQIIVAYFAKKLFTARRKGKAPPFVLLVEESHNFAREKAAKGHAIAKGVIETIAREGRKFGASLCLVSQRPVQLSTTALSQCNTNIILRVTNPYDIDHIGESCEGIDKGMLGSITTLRVGEALVVGEAVHYPIFVKVRKRKSKSSPKGEPLDAQARKFEEMQVKKEKDVVEAFL